MDPKITYVFAYFCSVYGVPLEIDAGYGTSDRTINIHRSRTTYFHDFSAFPAAQIVWKNWGEQRLPVLFPGEAGAPLLTFREGRAFVNDDLLASAFFFLSGWQEHVYMQQFSAIRYPFRESLQHQLNMTGMPVVNHYFDVLKSAIEGVCNVTLTPQPPGNAPYALCLTHDIDTAYTGWQQDFPAAIRQRQPGAALKIIARRLLGKDTCFNFAHIHALEARYGANSSFYFIARKNKVFARAADEKGFASESAAEKISDPGHFFKPKRSAGYTQALENADYDIRRPEMQQVFDFLRKNGAEVGIHGSFGSSLSATQFHDDLSRFGSPVSGGRFHYLCFDVTRTFGILEDAGQQYDSTLGFAEAAGFRNGICYPFPPFNIRENRPYRLLEIPLMVMDTTYRSYQKVPPSEVFPQIAHLLKIVREFNGCLTVLWHNAYFTPYKFAGWQAVYEEILRQGQSDGALMTGGAEICKKWDSQLAKYADTPALQS